MGDILLNNANSIIKIAVENNFSVNESDNYVPSQASIRYIEYKAIIHNTAYPKQFILSENLLGIDNEGEFLRGRLVEPLDFDLNEVNNQKEIIIESLFTEQKRQGIILIPTKNPFLKGNLGAVFYVVLGKN
jgi:hypothetical protein